MRKRNLLPWWSSFLGGQWLAKITLGKFHFTCSFLMKNSALTMPCADNSYWMRNFILLLCHIDFTRYQWMQFLWLIIIISISFEFQVWIWYDMIELLVVFVTTKKFGEWCEISDSLLSKSLVNNIGKYQLMWSHVIEDKE